MNKLYALLLVVFSSVYGNSLSLDHNFIKTYKSRLHKELLAAKIIRYSTIGGSLAFLGLISYKFFFTKSEVLPEILAEPLIEGIPADSIDLPALIVRVINVEKAIVILKEKLGGSWFSYIQNTALGIGVSVVSGRMINFIFHDVSISWFIENKTSVRELFQELKMNTEILDNPREPEFKKLFARNAADQIIRSLVIQVEKTIAYMQLKVEQVSLPKQVAYMERVVTYFEQCFIDFLQEYEQKQEYGAIVKEFEHDLNQSFMRFAQLEQFED